MAYVGETPWHGLGVKLETPPANVAEALKAAGLDWTVSLQQLQLANGTPVDQWAVVRDTDSACLGIVGAGYHPRQNADTFSNMFDPFIEAKVANVETAGSLRGGARVWMLAKMDRPDSVIVAKADDRVSKYLLLAMGHDGHLAIHVGLTPIRVVCQNTLSVALGNNSGVLRVHHTRNAVDKLDIVRGAIEAADHEFERAADAFRALGRRRVSVAKLRAYVDSVFPKRKDAPPAEAEDKPSKIVETIEELMEKGRGMDLPGVKGTAWAAYNAMTEYLTWQRGRTPDARLNNLWLGGKTNVGTRALQSAVTTFMPDYRAQAQQLIV